MAQPSAAKVLPFVRRAQEAAMEAAARRAPQELVKVPADLLEGLVNLAGETSIFRGRVEQQVSDVGFTLSEMEATIERVRDQLRRLDTETQAQILSRYQAEAEYADEVTEFLVDVEGDADFSRSRRFGADFEPVET